MCKKLIILTFCLIGQICFCQEVLKGEFAIEHINGSKTSLEFLSNFKFKKTFYTPQCGIGIEEIGDYYVENDTLFLVYDHSYSNYNDDVSKQKYVIIEKSKTEAKKIKINITTFDNSFSDYYQDSLSNFVEILPNAEIYIKNKIFKTEYSPLELMLNKQEKIIITAKIFDTVPIEIELDGNYNYDIEIYLNPYIYDLSKDYIDKYEIIKIESDKIVFGIKNSKGKRKKNVYLLEN